jgi:hypothetical protein
MLQKIKEKYKGFSDAVISEISYKRYLNPNGSDKGIVEVYLRAENNEGDYEIVKLKFIEIISFRFIESRDSSSLILNEILMKQEDEIITFDFFPLIYSSGIIENINSDFMIKCKDISFEIMDQYSNGSKLI